MMTLLAIFMFALWATVSIALFARAIDSMLRDSPAALVYLFFGMAWVVTPIVLVVQA